jgi:hypothetical protein
MWNNVFSIIFFVLINFIQVKMKKTKSLIVLRAKKVENDKYVNPFQKRTKG